MPALDERQVYYYNVYQAIHRSRPAGMAGPLPISISQIRDYCEFLYISQISKRARILRFVNALDDEYLEYVREQTPKPKPSKK